MIGGLSHITFIVSDLDKMEVILMKVLDAKKIYDSGDRTYSLSKERFFDIGGIWVATMEVSRYATKLITMWPSKWPLRTMTKNCSAFRPLV